MTYNGVRHCGSDLGLVTPHHVLRPEHRSLGANALVRGMTLTLHPNRAAEADAERATHAILH